MWTFDEFMQCAAYDSTILFTFALTFLNSTFSHPHTLLLSHFTLLQDWQELLVGVGIIYPIYYLIGTALLVVVTATLLCSARVIG